MTYWVVENSSLIDTAESQNSDFTDTCVSDKFAMK